MSNATPSTPKTWEEVWRRRITNYIDRSGAGGYGIAEEVDWCIKELRSLHHKQMESVKEWAIEKKSKLTMKWDSDKAQSVVYDSIIFGTNDFPVLSILNKRI